MLQFLVTATVSSYSQKTVNESISQRVKLNSLVCVIMKAVCTEPHTAVVHVVVRAPSEAVLP